MPFTAKTSRQAHSWGSGQIRIGFAWELDLLRLDLKVISAVAISQHSRSTEYSIFLIDANFEN